jgi:hypothetical protein
MASSETEKCKFVSKTFQGRVLWKESPCSPRTRQLAHNSKHSFGISVTQAGPGTACAGVRPWHCPLHAGFVVIQNERIMGSLRLPLRFKGKPWGQATCGSQNSFSQPLSGQELWGGSCRQQWRLQEVRDAQNVESLLRAAIGSEQGQLQRVAMRAAASQTTAAGLPEPCGAYVQTPHAPNDLQGVTGFYLNLF